MVDGVMDPNAVELEEQEAMDADVDAEEEFSVDGESAE